MWGEHLEKEVKSLDKRLKEAQSEVDRLVTQRDTQIADRLLSMKQELAKANSQHSLDLKSRTAELETHHRVRESQQEKRAAEEKSQLMEMFKGELLRIGEEHRRAERELERMHRDRETELQRRAKVTTEANREQAEALETRETGAQLKDNLLGRFEQHRQSLLERHNTMRKSFTFGQETTSEP